MIPFATSALISQRVMSLTIWIFESFKQIYRFRLQNKHTSLSYTIMLTQINTDEQRQTDQWGVLHHFTHTDIQTFIHKQVKKEKKTQNKEHTHPLSQTYTDSQTDIH